MRIRVKCYDHRPMDQVLSEIAALSIRTGARPGGRIPLPTRIERFTVNRSPHVDKKSREQFEMRTHKRIMYIHELTPATIDALMLFDIHPMVDLKVKL
ncbi:30S ribosomal protein S10 [Mesorhizobium sp. CU2]|uniref:30S ribosomal protein S10 n=1 Tax=unclassified Mesorhizobium TaxID=325217 RepID=UPI001129F621|nr:MULTISPECIES: 30S ribosomal protein S10 [unclassified Mesorhizobium]TPN82555.1 30S ribosomal protein S10 [Mesorhizobium sp. CU3]TPO01343.1 30S ribosomal protein S10 [Mesorhizobium sp. CU2]